MSFEVHPLTPDRWTAFEDLFGRAGACNGCWCMYWRLGAAYGRQPRELNKAALRAIVAEGPPPGLLAYDGPLAVGWCQLTPRADLPWLDRARRLGPVDNIPVWSVSCFFVRRAYRRRGVTRVLIEAAVERAGQAGAAALEAYPIDIEQPKASRNRFTGIASVFEAAGFRVVARRSPSRPILRHDLGR